MNKTQIRMEKQTQSPVKLDRPYVESNGYDGVIHISEGVDHKHPIAEILVRQHEIWEEDNGKIRRKRRSAFIADDVNKLLSPRMEYEPGERIGGIITVIESYDPPDHDDPMAFLKMDEGKIVRVNGRCVYTIEKYQFDARQIDILIQEDNDRNLTG